jgi:Pro-kumamolisin, activation domain
LVPPRAHKIVAAAFVASVLVLGASGPVAASGEQRAVLPGSAPRGLAHARLVGHVHAEQSLDLVVTLEPRNAELLASLAAESSGRKPLSPERVRSLFFPRDADVAAVRSYLGGHGLKFRSVKGLSLFFSGAAAAAEDAFGVDLALYRDARGRAFRAPSGPLHLPAALVGKVAAVDGLDTLARYRPAQQLTANAVTPDPTCPAPDFQNENGGYLPADLAAAGAYNYQALLDAGADGGGENIAFVEFSNYPVSDVNKFKTCFGLTTPVNNISVNGGTLDRSGTAEVDLDIEIALAAAPGLEAAWVYIAPNTTSMAVMINQIVAGQATTDVHIVSISWGLCEAFISRGELSATNAAFQLAAVSGMSVFAASGDNGSSDCLPDRAGLAVGDPGAQPYVTAVGGTNLDLSAGRAETAWNSDLGAGGGGLSSLWPMPSWQSGVVGPDSSGLPCGVTTGYCRQVPDVALNADPDNGYIVYCFWEDCDFLGWLKVGGTSAAAPLLAAITADANDYSLTNGGDRLGFASPFFYDRFANGAPFFVDVTTGSNDVDGLGRYAAGSGYDLATGLGALDAALLAEDLKDYTAVPIDVQGSSLTASPTSNLKIRYGQTVVFSGDLVDTTASAPISDRRVWVELTDGRGIRSWTAVTDAAGHWSLSLSTAFRRKATWRAYFLGEAGQAAASTPAHVVYVVPKLTLGAKLRWVSGHYVVGHAVPFTVTGKTRPNMAGAIVTLQWRKTSSSFWRTATSARVGSLGGLSARGSWILPGRYYMRWRYPGSSSKPWMTGASPKKLFVVS